MPLLPVLGLLLLASTSARASILLDATWLQVTQGVQMTRTQAQLGATGDSTGTSIAVTLSYPAFATAFFIPKTPNGTLDLFLEITQGGAQAITATPSMGMGSPGIPGSVVLMTAKHGVGGNASMFMVGNFTLLAIPLSHGKDGQFTGTLSIASIPHNLTVDFFAWTPGTHVFSDLTTKGMALPDVTAAGSFMLTSPSGFGPVTLVSPSMVGIDGPLAQRRTVTFTTLRLFFPEPEAWLLFGAGALALALVARRRR